jgi:ABC-type Zn uptake system ZnuABC Zn-binding protein ZnuA
MRAILTFFIGIALLLTVVIGAGCGGDASTSTGSGSGDLSVVATTSQAADLTRNVVGDRGDVTQILAANADPHDYEPKPSDAEALIDTDLVVRSGGDLDLWLDQIVESSGTDAPVLTLIDGVKTIEDEDETDPHWWQDPTNAVLAVEEIRDELSAIDPEGAADFEANADAYMAQIEDLDSAIAACIDEVPTSDRKLVTSHDALGYYADRYGIDVLGAAIPALTTQAQASAGETADLVDLIEQAGVGTIYSEAGVSSELEQAIADEAEAQVGGELWADTLGPEGSDGATYLEAMASNTATVVDGFTDGASSCRIDVGG